MANPTRLSPDRITAQFKVVDSHKEQTPNMAKVAKLNLQETKSEPIEFILKQNVTN